MDSEKKQEYVIEFTDKLCQMNTVIDKYLKAKKARAFTSMNSQLPNEFANTILDVLGEKTDQYEKQIIVLATELSQIKPQE